MHVALSVFRLGILLLHPCACPLLRLVVHLSTGLVEVPKTKRCSGIISAGCSLRPFFRVSWSLPRPSHWDLPFDDLRLRLGLGYLYLAADSKAGASIVDSWILIVFVVFEPQLAVTTLDFSPITAGGRLSVDSHNQSSMTSGYCVYSTDSCNCLAADSKPVAIYPRHRHLSHPRTSRPPVVTTLYSILA